ncbi:MAG: tripartite tricarboxylate transporter substrate binding protein [Burkholderiales bacterium]|jgi:tripartite-type tricarboxylate transporter receptor subunit TctC|nr:tripartite tricarboxylate transporter substrate binding protein [Burkholderiales bacterium]
MTIKNLVTALLLSGFVVQPALAQSGKYPDRPIRLVAPFPPGGTVDVVARLVAPIATASLGQQVVIENRVGASGIIGSGYVAQAKPDGYTLLINTTPLVTNTLMYNKVPYNVLTDFAPISNLATTPSFVSVHPSVPARSVKELVALAKSRPGTLNYGGAGTGTNPHIAGELFNYLAKTEIAVVQYKGGGPALTAAISGEVGVSFSGVAGATGFVQSGRLRALGVTSLKPVAALPGVPTIASVLPGYEFSAWFVVAAPKGTPRDIVNVLNQNFNKAVNSPELGQRFSSEGIDPIGTTPEQTATHLENELKKFANVIRERKMKAE